MMPERVPDELFAQTVSVNLNGTFYMCRAFGRVLVDAGPLVALADPLDAHHRQCVELATTLLNPQITTWPVLAEAAWIMRRSQHFFLRLLPSFANGEIAIHQAGSEALTFSMSTFSGRCTPIVTSTSSFFLSIFNERMKASEL